MGDISVRLAWRSQLLLLLSVLCSERWMKAAKDATSVFQMEGAKQGSTSAKGIAERLTLGIIRILGMYSVEQTGESTPPTVKVIHFPS